MFVHLRVTLETQWPVHHGVFRGQIGLVKVILVTKIGGTKASLYNKTGMGSDEHCNGPSTPRGSGWSRGINRDVSANSQGQASIPS